MKKLLAIAVICASLFTLTSCADNSAANAPDVTTPVQTTKVTATQVTKVTAPSFTGNTNEPIVNENDNTLNYYDDNGRLIKKEQITTKSFSLFEYYPSGNLKEKSEYDFQGNLEARFELYENGEYMSISSYQIGVIKRYTEFNISGNTIRSQEYENGMLRTDTIYKDSSSLTKERVTVYNEDGSLDHYIVYEDDRTVFYHPDGTINYYTIGDISYYPNGNVYIKVTRSEDNVKMTYYYKPDGELDYYTKDEYTFETITTTTYDANHNVISVKETPAFTPD